MPELSRPKILLLDDDVDMQELIVSRFKDKGLSFTVFADPSEPIAAQGRDPKYFAQFDLIITDFRMPTMDGIEFIKQMRKASDKTPIILMTATNRVEIAVDAIKAGAYDFVVKPLNFTHLGVAIDRALDLSRLRSQNEALKSAVKSNWNVAGVIAKSQATQNVLDLARRVANSSASVLIQGESGTGKEVIAKTIHHQGTRASEPFIAINCTAIPENLLESELFGHAKGSFTGASEKKIGLFEEAGNGTIFLDEIGDLNLSLQAKLLRVLQERKIKRVGENVERSINARIITATHKDLATEVREKRFREDLYFRLNIIQIVIPPLRERKEDIIPLAQHFFEKFRAQNESEARGFSKAALEYMLNLRWSGNVRELENAIERAVILSRGPLIEIEDLPNNENLTRSASSTSNRIDSTGPSVAGFGLPHTGKLPTLEEFSRLYVAHVLKHVGGIKERAARILEIDRKTLYRKLADLEKSETANLEPEGPAPTVN